MIEPLLYSISPDTFYGPMEGLGEWVEITYPQGVAGLLWTNTSEALMVLRTDYTESSIVPLREIEDSRRKYMGDNTQPYQAFIQMAGTSKIFSGYLETDMVSHARRLTMYDPENTKYYRLTETDSLIKITDNQTLVYKNNEWVPVEDYSSIMNQPMTEVRML